MEPSARSRRPLKVKGKMFQRQRRSVMRCKRTFTCGNRLALRFSNTSLAVAKEIIITRVLS